MKRFLSQVISATIGLWIATLFISGVIVRPYPDSNFFGISLAAQWQIFLFLGIVIGLISYFIKPLLNTIVLPLKIITIPIFSFSIEMILIFILDLIFDELIIPFFLPLFYTSLIIWFTNIVLQFILVKKK
mgnify:CR=1 FL=1